MKTFSLGSKFYFIFFIIFSIPSSWVAGRFTDFAKTLPDTNFFHYLFSFGVLEAPSTIVVLLFFFFVSEKWLWQIPPIPYFLGVPNINGRHTGTLTSTHIGSDEQNGTYNVVIEINQSLTQTNVYLYTERSCSYSLIANICKNHNENDELVYVYQNKTVAMNADKDMRDHHGVASLQIFDSGAVLTGSYFNNPRERGRYGVIDVRRESRFLKQRFE
jgi:hypothetical protein